MKAGSVPCKETCDVEGDLDRQGMSCPSCVEQLNEAPRHIGVSNIDAQLDWGAVAVDHKRRCSRPRDRVGHA